VAIQFQGRVPNAQPILNAGKSRIWGVEVDASLTPFEGFKLDAGYTYLNTKLQEFIQPPLPIYYSALLPTAEVGEALALSPRNRVTLNATYTLPLDESIGEISFGVTYIHTDANRALSSKVAPNFVVQASDLVNLNVDWESAFGQPIDLAFFMTNVTNQKRIVYPSGAFATTGQIAGHLNGPKPASPTRHRRRG
jgi:iron complex outermembrane receptor protein